MESELMVYHPKTVPITSIEKPTVEPTSEPDSDALSEPYAPMREGYMGHIYPKDILIYHKF